MFIIFYIGLTILKESDYMNEKELRNGFRSQLINVHAVAVIAATIVEIVAYILYVVSGTCELSLTCPYLWHSLVIPSAVNFIAHIVARCICKSKKYTDNRKNSVLIYATMVTTTVVSVVHRDFIIAACAFIFPMMLSSAKFNDRNLLKHSLFISLASITLTTLVLYAENKIGVANAVNITALYAFAIISYLSGTININYSNRSNEIIKTQAMQNTMLEQFLQQDTMTGLYNHKMFYSQLEEYIEKYNREKINFCLAVIDVDDFKTINDTYGHDNGDKVLTALANIMNEFCAHEDLAFRYGGEEFAIIFVNKNLSQANSAMKSILSSFQQQKYSFTKKSITFSCGLVQFNDSFNKDSFFSTADAAMYKAKKSGKNCIYKQA